MYQKKKVINMQEQLILKAKNVRKSYGSKQHQVEVLKGIDLAIEEGEFVGIMGPSGSGKTTLMNVLATIDRATSGSILINQTEISTMKEKELSLFRRNELGFIFQDYNLLDTLSVKENILLPVSLGKEKKASIESRYQTIVSTLGMKEHEDKFPSQLSGGQKQRTAASRALINEPSMIFADEPTGALDSKSASALLESLEAVNRTNGTTILMVSHDPLASSYCSRVIFLRDGQVYSELRRGNETRQAFFQEILKVQGMLGGEVVDTI